MYKQIFLKIIIIKQRESERERVIKYNKAEANKGLFGVVDIKSNCDKFARITAFSSNSNTDNKSEKQASQDQ